MGATVRSEAIENLLSLTAAIVDHTPANDRATYMTFARYFKSVEQPNVITMRFFNQEINDFLTHPPATRDTMVEYAKLYEQAKKDGRQSSPDLATFDEMMMLDGLDLSDEHDVRTWQLVALRFLLGITDVLLELYPAESQA